MTSDEKGCVQLSESARAYESVQTTESNDYADYALPCSAKRAC